MNLTITRMVLVVTLLTLIVSPVRLFAETAKFISLDELKPGMKGKALSVLRGTEPESFGVELQGIVDGPVAGSRYMLLKLRDESLRMGSGFSGSPVYFDGRLAGAISHMEQNLASQMVMAVPIGSMLEDGAKGASSISGQSVAIKELLPGSMIAITQVRGDFWMGSSGTVTYVDNGLILAFGHENLFSGDNVQLPIHRATVHGVIPRMDMSHKESSPLEEIGSVIWDGKSALVGRLGSKTPMAQLTVDYKGTTGAGRHFNLEMINHNKMFPGIISRIVRSVLYDHLPNSPTGSDIDITLKINLNGLDKPVIINQRFSAELLKADTSSTNPLQMLLSGLLLPITDKMVISSLSMSLIELAETKTARIAETSFTRTKASAGDTVRLLVRLNGPYGEARNISVPVMIPADFSSVKFTVSVASGRTVRPAEVSPGSVADIAVWLAAVPRSDELVVLAPGTVTDSDYPEARLKRTIARTPWNVEGSGEASIAVVGE